MPILDEKPPVALLSRTFAETMEATENEGDTPSAMASPVLSTDGYECPALCLSPTQSGMTTDGDREHSESRFSVLTSAGVWSSVNDSEAFNVDKPSNIDGKPKPNDEEKKEDGLTGRMDEHGEGDDSMISSGERECQNVAPLPLEDKDTPAPAAEVTRCDEEQQQDASQPQADQPVLPDAPLEERPHSVDSDDDLTVECASPRDVRSLEDTTGEEQPLEAPVSHNTTGAMSLDVVHPLPPPEPTPSTVPLEVYSLRTLFPNVYETPSSQSNIVGLLGNGQSQSRDIEVPQDSQVRKRAAPSRSKRPPSSSEREQMLLREIATVREELRATTKSLQTQLQVVESERKQVVQRNTRLKNQLTTLTTDLARTKAEAAKLKTENELYATKMPRLQAELSEETLQVDEKHAQTIQSQIEITQLRAKVQVLQTRTDSLDQQVGTLTQELRASKKELRRRTIVQQQGEDKIKKLENELHDVKVEHAQELLIAKQRHGAAMQRFESQRQRENGEMKRSHHHQLDELKAALSKAIRRRKELEHSYSNLESQVTTAKKRADDIEETSRSQVKMIKSLESVIIRAERTESTLRGQVASLRLQLQMKDQELKRQRSMSRSSVRVVRLRTVESPPEQRVDESGGRELCRCCEAILMSVARLDRSEQSDEDAPTLEDGNAERSNREGCRRCASLEQEIEAAQEELARVRASHVDELRVQSTAFERLIMALRGRADVASSACA